MHTINMTLKLQRNKQDGSTEEATEKGNKMSNNTETDQSAGKIRWRI